MLDVIREVNDLLEQADLFDMEVDWETLELVPKNTFEEPYWLRNYRERQNNSDKYYDHIAQGFDGKEGERSERQAA